METNEYLGISLISAIKELAGRVRILEEVVKGRPELQEEYQRQLSYSAAYEEDEYQRLVNDLQRILEKLSTMDSDPEPGAESGDAP